MTIEQICEFVTLAEQRNYLITADIMYMTQATLSRHIISLEEELGFSLFDRTTKRIELTSDGTHFLAFARDIIKLKNSYEEAIKKAKSINEGVLRVGYHYMITLYGVNRMVTNFVEANPNKKVSITEDSPANLVEMLKNGYLDIIIFQDDSFNRVKDLDYVSLQTDKMVAITSMKNELSKYNNLPLTTFKDSEFVTSAPDQEPVSIMFGACRKANFKPNIAKTGFVGRSLYDWINKNPQYVSLEWKKVASAYNDGNYSLIDVEPTLFYYTILSYNKETITSFGKKMIKFLTDKSKDI